MVTECNVIWSPWSMGQVEFHCTSVTFKHLADRNAPRCQVTLSAHAALALQPNIARQLYSLHVAWTCGQVPSKLTAAASPAVLSSTRTNTQ